MTDIHPEEFDPYQTLNVTPDASIEEIQESFKKLSRTFHPDRNSSIVDESTLNASRQQFEAVTKAKEILCNSQTRQAYDHFGIKGIEMMQRNVYNEIKSLQIGKKYRNDDAVHHLLKYYLKREASIQLDKLVSCTGHCELGIDATSLYEEFVDLIFRNETMPQFINNLWNGIPTLQIVIDENGSIYDDYEPVNVVPDDYDFDAEEEIYNESDYDNEEQLLSMAELMSQSVQNQVSIIQNALNTGDMTTLSTIPVQRQSVRPTFLSFLLSVGYQYSYNDDNTVLISSTQYNEANADKLYQSINIEWHKQYNRYMKFISACSIGLSTLSTRFTVSRDIDSKTNIDLNLYFNFFDPFWKTFLKLFGANDAQEENVADLFEDVFADEKKKNNTSFLYILPEILTVCGNGIWAIYNFMRNAGKGLIDSRCSGYPGFDIGFGIHRVIFNDWMGMCSVRMGRTPSFSWNIFRKIGAKHWNFKIETGRNTMSLLVKHNRQVDIDETLRFYTSLQLDVSNLVKFECGFSKLWCDDHDELKFEDIQRSIELNGTFGIEMSLNHGISLQCGVQRGSSQINVPIKLSKSPSSFSHVLLSFCVPLITYYGYKLYYRPYCMRARNDNVTKRLNERGLSLHNKRQFALKQQYIMNVESDRNGSIEKEKNGLCLLCAFYGDNVQQKVFDAIRIHLHLDEDDDDEDGEEDEDEEKEEEKEIHCTIRETSDGDVPPLLFDIYHRQNESKIIKKKKNSFDVNKYKLNLCDIDWIGIEHDLEKIMRNDHNEDIHLLSFMNVRIVLQYMVNNDKSRLSLSSGTKSYLPGFYDCCPDKYSSKQLFVVYKYNDQYKYVTISDMFPLTLPNDSHSEWFNCRD